MAKWYMNKYKSGSSNNYMAKWYMNKYMSGSSNNYMAKWYTNNHMSDSSNNYMAKWWYTALTISHIYVLYKQRAESCYYKDHEK